jgi:hypothetical protein
MAFAILTFRDSVSCAGEPGADCDNQQRGIYQVWPKMKSDCWLDNNGNAPSTATSPPFGFSNTQFINTNDVLMNSQANQSSTINFCVYNHADPLWSGSTLANASTSGYEGIAAVLQPGYLGLSTTTAPVQGLSPSWASAVWNVLPPNSGGTPLASSLCEVVGILSTETGQNNYIVHETDGGENGSQFADVTSCFGGDAPVPSAVNYCATDWNFENSTVDGDDGNPASWEQRVVRTVTEWYGPPAPSLSNLAVDVDAPWNPPTGTGSTCATNATQNNVVWIENIQYQFNTVTAALVALPGSAPHTAEPAMFFQSAAGSPSIASMASLATPMVAGGPDIDPTELAFFQALGGSSPLARFRQYVFTPGTTAYGVPHAVPGDVDNSGCTDQADLDEILQSDVWLQQAVPPLQIAIQADLNADGWVNQVDLKIVLDNWGAGCNPLPQPPQGGYVAIPYVPTGLAATPGSAEVSLVWTASSMATGYSVLRSTTSGSGFVSIASGLTATSYTDATVTNGTTYYYEVTATDSQGTSAASSQVSATPEAAPPPAPCANPVTWTNGQTGNFNTTGPVCGRIAGAIDGWGCSNFAGRTIKVDNTVVTCGQTPLPAAWSDGYHYFAISAGKYSYASLNWW